MTTLQEFLAGEPLTYSGYDKRKHQLTYRAGVGAVIERKGEEIDTADVTDDASARRLYHNLTRRPQRAERGK